MLAQPPSSEAEIKVRPRPSCKYLESTLLISSYLRPRRFPSLHTFFSPAFGIPCALWGVWPYPALPNSRNWQYREMETNRQSSFMLTRFAWHNLGRRSGNLYTNQTTLRSRSIAISLYVVAQFPPNSTFALPITIRSLWLSHFLHNKKWAGSSEEGSNNAMRKSLTDRDILAPYMVDYFRKMLWANKVYVRYRVSAWVNRMFGVWGGVGDQETFRRWFMYSQIGGAKRDIAENSQASYRDHPTFWAIRKVRNSRMKGAMNASF